MMKKLTDEEIQKIVEDNLLQQNTGALSEAEQGDLKMYSLLFAELKGQVMESPPADFADKVIEKINRRKAMVEALKYYGFIFCLVSLFIGVTIVTFAYAELPYTNDILAIMNKYKGSVIFGLISLFLIQFFDQLLVKSRLSKYNS